MSWEEVTTPNPNEKALRIWLARGTSLRMRGQYVSGVTTLKEFLTASGPMSELEGDFVYTYSEGPDGDGRQAYYFALKKTEEELLIPYESFVRNIGNHRWPDVLKSLSIVPDYAFPRATNIIEGDSTGIVVGPTYRVEEELIPEMNEGSSFYVEDFIGHTWFTLPRYKVPVPLAVSVAIPGGGQYRHPESLHDELEIGALNSASATYLGGTGSSAAGGFGAQSFKATNFKRWRPYWISDEQVRRDGVIYRRRVRVRPPRTPKRFFNLN